MRVTGDWVDVTICNLSSRGLMAKCHTPPRSGSYVEIRNRGTCIVGRVAWSQGLRFGIRSQERIDMAALLEEPTLKARRAANDRRADAVRRPMPRPRAVAPEERAERSRRFSRAFEWCVIAGAGAIAVSQVAAVANQALADPLHTVKTTLAGG